MSKKKQGSCLGLFFKSFFVTALILANLAAAAVMIGIKFWGVDPAVWTNFGEFSSWPWLTIYAILGCSFCFGFLIASVGAAVGAIFGGESKKKSSPSKPSRPTSNRKTTV